MLYISRKVFAWISFFLFVSLPVQLSAQLWPGNLGAPVVNIDFGDGNSVPLPGKSTSFEYTKGCPSPGKYSIEHFLFGCAAGTWILLTGDHTHNHDGNYMLVNGATAPGTVIVDTVNGLCGNTTYQFSAWLTNSMLDNACNRMPVLPNLTLSIETVSGTVLKSFDTGDLPITGSKTWVEYGVYYTTPATPLPLVLRIKSNVGGDCGSGFVLDDITLKAAGPQIAVTINGKDTSRIDLCGNYTDPVELKASYSTGFTDPVLQWQRSDYAGLTWADIPGATGATYFVPKRDDSLVTYRVKMAERSNAGNSSCGIFSAMIATNVYRIPEHGSLKQVMGCLDKDLVLVPPNGFLTFLWTGPKGYVGDTQNPVIKNIQYDDEGLYTVILSPDYVCTVIDSLQVKIFPGTTVATRLLYNICEGTTINLAATGEGVYAWTPATGLSDASSANPRVSPRDSTQYKVVLTNSYGCQDSAQVVINVFKNATVTAGPDKKILMGDTVLLEGAVKGTAVNYSWSPAVNITDATAIQPNVFPSAETRYTLNAVSTVGCGNASSDVLVTVYKDIFLPGAFSPNGDGKNDIFRLSGLDSYQLVSFGVFNRGGHRIFSTTNLNHGWDGTFNGIPQEAGAYIYYLEIETRPGKRTSRKGSVLLLR